MKIEPISSSGSQKTFGKGFPFTGENALCTLDPDLMQYLRSVLAGQPLPPPDRPPEAWTLMIRLLDAHWIRPTITWLLDRAGPDFQPPAPIMQQLRTEYLWSSARGITEYRQVGQIVSALREDSIEPVFLKGFALGRTVYPEYPMRPGSDIDLLVLPDQVPECTARLLALGYDIPIDCYRIDSCHYHHQNAYPVRNHGSPLEVHWRLDTGFGLHGDEVLEGVCSRAVRVHQGSFSFLVPDPVDHLVFAAHHAIFQHSEGVRLSWLFDLFLLARSLTSGQWETLRDRSVAWNSRLAVEHGLRLAEQWTPLVIPPEFADFSRWPGPGPQERKAWRYAGTHPRSIYSSLMLSLMGCPTVRDKAGYLFRFVFPPPPVMRSPHYRQVRGALAVSYLDYWSRVPQYLAPLRKGR